MIDNYKKRFIDPAAIRRYL